jgi:hypothetical protein
MPQPNTIPGDLMVQGVGFFKDIVPMPGATGHIDNSLISPTAAIDATKSQADRQSIRSLANYGATPAAVRQVIGYVTRAGGGTIVGFSVGVVQAIASGTVTVDLYVAGASVLTAPIALSSAGGSGGSAGDVVAGTIATPALVLGSRIEVVVTVSTPSGGGGLFASLVTREN